MHDVFKNIEAYNLVKKQRVLMMFDCNVADMISDKKIYLVVTELFTRINKLKFSLVFNIQSYFK